MPRSKGLGPTAVGAIEAVSLAQISQALIQARPYGSDNPIASIAQMIYFLHSYRFCRSISSRADDGTSAS